VWKEVKQVKVLWKLINLSIEQVIDHYFLMLYHPCNTKFFGSSRLILWSEHYVRAGFYVFIQLTCHTFELRNPGS
jgi:hypothetical protein